MGGLGEIIGLISGILALMTGLLILMTWLEATLEADLVPAAAVQRPESPQPELEAAGAPGLHA